MGERCEEGEEVSEWIKVKKDPPHDKIDWIKIIVKIRKNRTGEIRDYETEGLLDCEYESKLSTFIWSDGNFSCDCNRSNFFGEDEDCSDGKYSINIVNPKNGEIVYQEYES